MNMNKAECEQRAKELAAKLLRANADPLEVQYAVGQLMPLYEMISEGEAEIARLDDELNRQKAKTEYEAERAGNIENDLDEAKAALADMLEPYGATPAKPPFFTESIAPKIANARRLIGKGAA